MYSNGRIKRIKRTKDDGIELDHPSGNEGKGFKEEVSFIRCDNGNLPSVKI